MKIFNISGLKKTYSLLRKTSRIQGPDIDQKLIDQIMYSFEALPPFGKEYWWFLFLDNDGPKPIQLMLMICRKYGKEMWIDDTKMTLKDLGKDGIKSAVTGWLYDGNKMINLGNTNGIVKITDKKIITEIAGNKLIFEGSFPFYKLTVGDIIDLNISHENTLVKRNKEAYGIFWPPFGVGYFNLYPDVSGTIFGKTFQGTGHLQKVVGIAPHFPYNWVRIIFKNGSMLRFSDIRPKKIHVERSIDFYDNNENKIIKFSKPSLKISRSDNSLIWTLEGQDKNNYAKVVLEAYAKKQFVMKGGGSLTYVEYCVIPKELILKIKEKTITLNDLGDGVGTLEDAY
ncbi:MAG: hypothetical protein ABH876_01770 [Patescibacteria group bacterium]|nr:hypothetical protein [Patescibacteria group bacterium]